MAKIEPLEKPFEVKVTPAAFDKISRLAIDLDLFPWKRDEILDILTQQWSENGGFFIPAMAREGTLTEIKLTVIPFA